MPDAAKLEELLPEGFTVDALKAAVAKAGYDLVPKDGEDEATEEEGEPTKGPFNFATAGPKGQEAAIGRFAKKHELF